jgi:hypothetical protein
MKRILLAFLLLSGYYIVNAQVVLESSNKVSVSIMPYKVQKYALGHSFDNLQVEKYCSYLLVDSVLKFNFYNFDYTFYKSVDIKTPKNAKYRDLLYVSTKTFNSDNSIEFILDIAFDDANFNTVHHPIMYNEDGEVIYDFGFERIINLQTNSNNEIKLLTATGSNNTNDLAVKVYGFNTQIPNDVKILKSNENFQSPYPNPANQNINLPYQLKSGEQTDMQIYDANGKLIATKRIDAAFDKIVLNVSGYEKGMYVYTYNGKTAKFVVE